MAVAMRRTLDGRGDWLRLVGGLLFASGAVALWIRKSNTDDWGDFALLLTLLVPCVLLYAIGMGARALDDGAEPWQSVYLVFGVLLAPLALFQFLEWIDGDTGDSLNAAWIFFATGLLAAAASFRRGARYGAFLMALAWLAAWLLLWDKILDDPEVDTFRWLLLILAAIYLAMALGLRSAGRAQASEVVTGAALAAVAAGAIGAIQAAIGLAGSFGGLELSGEADTNTGWDILLLVVSLLAIGYGARTAARGPAYVGAIGLFAFIVIVGAELGALIDGDSPEGELVGWPLILLLVGAAAVVLSAVMREPPDQAPPPAPGTPPDAGSSFPPGGVLDQAQRRPPAE